MNKEEDFIDEIDLIKAVKILMVRLLSYVDAMNDLIDDNLIYKVTVKRDIKKRIKWIQKQIFIIKTLIKDADLGEETLESENLNLNRFNFLDNKSVVDDLRCLICDMINVHIFLENIDEQVSNETKSRIRGRLKAIYRYIMDIEKLIDDGDINN